MLVNGNSQTIYLFEKDKNGKSACSGSCATNWPPVLTKGAAMAGTGVKKSLLGTTKRSDGTTQVTYNKHPLYRFKGDANKVGAAKGEEHRRLRRGVVRRRRQRQEGRSPTRAEVGGGRDRP